ncbi:MAG: hypothetical protein JWN78_1718 [Bacteroidota bacterium]|nr:hypothetical protein [Bacteroidota bacterium]
MRTTIFRNIIKTELVQPKIYKYYLNIKEFWVILQLPDQ